MLFLAPQSGKKTRAKIQRDGLDLRDQMVQTVGDAVTLGRRHVRRTASRVRKQTKEMAQRGQDMVDGQSEIVGNAVEAEKAAVHDLANG
jgi:gas vesicle protein